MFHYSESPYVIRGGYCQDDGYYLYWSNADGWVDRESATVFNGSIVSLPIGWTAIEKAKCQDCNGAGAVPAIGPDDGEDNGYVRCPTCNAIGG